MRKLAVAAISFSTAIYAANYIFPFGRLIVPAVICAVLGAALAAMQRKWLRPGAIALVFFSLGLLCFHLHYEAKITAAESFEDKSLYVYGEILDYPDVYEDYCRLEVRVTNYDMPNLKAYLYDNDRQLADAKPGQKVSLPAKVTMADTIYGESSDSYYSKGIFLKLSSRGEIKLHGGGLSLYNFPSYLSHFLVSRISSTFDDDSVVFMRSLMLGDKADFYDDVEMYVSMSKAGLMHIVAVSGMHIAFLVSLLHFILGRGRLSAIICIVLCWIFALVTGAGPAVLRAAFMQSVLLMAPVLGRENDPITSLSFILAIILAANPFAAASISLQLSFGAMAGIILFFDKIYKLLSKPFDKLRGQRVLKMLAASAALSLSVMPFTVPLTAVHFGYVSMLSVLTNLLCFWAVSVCFSLGWICCAISFIPVVGAAAAWICSLLVDYIRFAAGIISDVPFSVFYMETEGAWLWLALTYVVFICCAFIKTRAMLKYSLASVLSLAMLSAIIFRAHSFYTENDVINILDVGQGQCLTAFSEDATVVVDCGNTATIDDAGMICASHLCGCGRKDVDVLVLSHLHADHANGAEMLMELTEVENLVLPAEYDDSDKLYSKILSCAQRNGTRVIRISSDSRISCGDIMIDIYKSTEQENENERCLISKLTIEDYELLCLADATADMERRLVYRNDFSSVDGFLVSHHGSKYSSSDQLLDEIGGELAIISVGNNYYGHPAKETLERLEAYGYNILRTDVNGRIELRIG